MTRARRVGRVAGMPSTSPKPASHPLSPPVAAATAHSRESVSELPRRCRVVRQAAGRRRLPRHPPTDRAGSRPRQGGRQADAPQAHPVSPVRPARSARPRCSARPSPSRRPGGRSDFRDFGRPDALGRGGGPVPHHPSGQHAPGANSISPVGEGPESGPNFDAFTAHRSPQPPANQPWPPPARSGPACPSRPPTRAESPPAPHTPPPTPTPPITPADHAAPASPPVPAGPPRRTTGGRTRSPRADPQGDAHWPGLVPKADPAWPDADAHAVTQWPESEPVGDGQRSAAQWPGARGAQGEASGPVRGRWPGAAAGCGWPRCGVPGRRPLARRGGPARRAASRRGVTSRRPVARRGILGRPPVARRRAPARRPAPRTGQPARFPPGGVRLTAPGIGVVHAVGGHRLAPVAEEGRGRLGAARPARPRPPADSERWRGPSEANQPPQGPWPPATPRRRAPRTRSTARGPKARPCSSSPRPWQLRWRRPLPARRRSGWQQNSGPGRRTPPSPARAQPQPGPPPGRPGGPGRWSRPWVVLGRGGRHVRLLPDLGARPRRPRRRRPRASPAASGAAPAAPNGDPKSTDFDVCAMLDPVQDRAARPGGRDRHADERPNRECDDEPGPLRQVDV